MKTLNQMFKNIEELEPSLELERSILSQIRLKKVRQTRRKLVLTYAGLSGSIAAAIYTSLVFGQALLKSEFWSILTLAFSDLQIVASNLGDFLYSLLETFPTLSAALILAPIFTLLLSISSYLSLHNHNKHQYI